jgi:glycosyltransferase involved in cell wall biosynthesis
MGKLLILSLGRKGGCVLYANNIIKNLNISFEVFASDNCILEKPINARLIETYSNRWEFIGATIFRLPILLIRILSGLIRRKYIALYTPYFHFWNILPILLFKAFRVPVVITVHDGVLHTGDGEVFEQFLNKWCIKLSNKVIFLTKYVKKITSEKYAFSAKTSVIPHGILRPDNLSFHMRNYPADNFKILFLGRINRYKGVEMLIEAFNLIQHDRPVSLTIAGKSSYSFQPLTLSRNVKIVDKYLSDNEIAHLLTTSDLLVLPYLEATQSGVITLGIASGIPILCTDVGGLKEQLIPMKEAVFTKPTVEGIKNGILEYLDDPNLYESVSTSLVTINQRLQWDVISREVVNFIRT